MAALKDIKRRITGIEDLKKITGTMYMVSSVRFKLVQKKVKYIDNLIEKLRDIMSKIPVKPRSRASLPLFIVIGSDRGLAGGYNSNLMDMVYKEISEHEGTKIISLGRKVEKFFAKKGMTTVKSFKDIDSQLPPEVINDLIREAIKSYKDDSEIYVAYTHFAGVTRLEPKIARVLPPLPTEGYPSGDYIFEPSPEEILELLMEFYLKMSIESFYLNSHISEQAARMVAMESATENADELLEDLGALYHQRRKDIITREISEIVSGAEGISL